MSRRTIGAMVVLLVVAAAGLVFVGALSPGEHLPGSSDEPSVPGAGGATTTGDAGSATTAGSAAGATTASDAGDATITADATTAADAGTPTPGRNSRYDFAIERVEECGTTCRNVTARLANQGSDPRENVRVTTAVYADGDLLWRGNESVGQLAAGETHTSTRRVTMGLGGAMTIQSNDGYVTIVTLVRSADGVARFEERRKVA